MIMAPVIKNNMAEIIKICESMELHSLYLFGSAGNKKKFTKNSDLDFLYQFKKDENGLIVKQYGYFDFMYSLEKLTGKKIDLVAEEKIKNKFFLARVNEEKVKIYES